MLQLWMRYRFGFNGQMKDNEIAGVGNHNTALFWEYDTRLGRRWNLDPKPQISISDYAAFYNNPISNVDILGDQARKKDAPTMKPASAYDYTAGKDSKQKQSDDIDYIKNGQDGWAGSRWLNTFKRDLNAPANAQTTDEVGTVKTLAETLPFVGPARRAFSTTKVFHGTGATQGVIEVSPRVVSVGAFNSWKSGQGVEFIYDVEKSIFAMGKPVVGVGSPNQRLVQAISSQESSNIVGGTVSYRSGVLHFTENSGHFGENWTPVIRKQFSEFVKSYTERPFKMEGFVPGK